MAGVRARKVSILPPLPQPSEASLAAAAELADTSGRREDTPIRKHFVRSADGTRPPLARIYAAGGRGNAVAVKLYLALIWRCASPPWSTQKPARFWATLLDLNDPEGDGARRINRALATLADVGLIELTPDPGKPSIVTIRDEHADGTTYQLPSSAYTKARSRRRSRETQERHMYFKVPTKLWTRGHLQQLEGASVVMLLILLAEQAGDGKPVWFSTEAFPQRYFISHKSRAVGTAQLRAQRLLTIDRESVAAYPGAHSYDPKRRRNIYYLTKSARLDNTVRQPRI